MQGGIRGIRRPSCLGIIEKHCAVWGVKALMVDVLCSVVNAVACIGKLVLVILRYLLHLHTFKVLLTLCYCVCLCVSVYVRVLFTGAAGQERRAEFGAGDAEERDGAEGQEGAGDLVQPESAHHGVRFR